MGRESRAVISPFVRTRDNNEFIGESVANAG